VGITLQPTSEQPSLSGRALPPQIKDSLHSRVALRKQLIFPWKGERIAEIKLHRMGNKHQRFSSKISFSEAIAVWGVGVLGFDYCFICNITTG
jgi:hypothetical protein